MGDFRLEDIWAIIQGLLIVGVCLFGGMALIALWPKIAQIAAAAWQRYVLFNWGEFLEWLADRDVSVNDFDDREDADPPAAVGIMSCERSEPSRTNERTERTDERSPVNPLWQEFLLDRTRERLIAVMVDSDLTVTEIRALLKGESAAIGQEIEASKKKLGKAPSQPYRTPIAGRQTDARYYQDDPELEYQAPPI